MNVQAQAQAQDIVFTKQPYIEDVGPRKIQSMNFSTLSESEISRIAEVQVYKGQYYDAARIPIEGGLLDPRMGPNKEGTCATCHGKFDSCPGHFGYIKLALPVYNVAYRDNIMNILKCICKGPNKEGTCATCHGKFDSCPGHFGYIKLALPVYNVAYRDNIMNILKCICKIWLQKNSIS
nr:DNA-directed RNA polymerase III subunit 1-like [Quercus suber]